MTRRELLQAGLTALTASTHHSHRVVSTQDTIDSTALAHFVDRLPIPRVMKATGFRPSSVDSLPVPYYRIPMRAIDHKVHRDLPPTRFWGYDSSVPGPIIEARSGQGSLVEWVNELPTE